LWQLIDRIRAQVTEVVAARFELRKKRGAQAACVGAQPESLAHVSRKDRVPVVEERAVRRARFTNEERTDAFRLMRHSRPLERIRDQQHTASPTASA
jgi:D-aminopeptidase